MGTPKKTNEQFLEEVRRAAGAEYEFLQEYVNSETKLLVRHNSELCGGHEYPVAPFKFLQGKRCPHPACVGPRRKAAWRASNSRPSIPRKTDSQFTKEVKALVGDEYTFLQPYVLNNVPLAVRHNTCGHEYRARPLEFVSNGRRCPACAKRGLRKSRAARRIEQWLSDNGYKFETEVTYPGLVSRNNRSLFFDFRVETAAGIVLVEYDGVQHEKGWMGNPKRLPETRENDRLKEGFCAGNGLKLIRLSYRQEKDLEAQLSSALERSTTIPVGGVRRKRLAAEMEGASRHVQRGRDIVSPARKRAAVA